MSALANTLAPWLLAAVSLGALGVAWVMSYVIWPEDPQREKARR